MPTLKLRQAGSVALFRTSKIREEENQDFRGVWELRRTLHNGVMGRLPGEWNSPTGRANGTNGRKYHNYPLCTEGLKYVVNVAVNYFSGWNCSTDCFNDSKPPKRYRSVEETYLCPAQYWTCRSG